MKIKTIELDDDGQPASVTAVMTTAEAAFFTRILGKMNDMETERHKLAGTWGELWDFFARFYDGGVKDFPTPEPLWVPVRLSENP